MEYRVLGVKLELIGFDSMGSRGMATIVYTGSQCIFIDPGVSIAPKRYGLPPHPLELERLQHHLDRIHRLVMECDILVISHYHRDHYLYRDGEEEYYTGKTLYIKNPCENINVSQRIRAYRLLKKMGVEEKAREVVYADNIEHKIDKDLWIRFSPPQPHGVEGTRLGYVLVTTINIAGIRIVHASDVQGPISTRTRDYLMSQKPHILIISGPPTYLLGKRLSEEDLGKAVENLVYIIENTGCLETIVLDHHLLRDLEYRDRVKEVYRVAREKEKKVITAAEYMGKPVEQLEAHRKELWESSGE